jgi:hypothetical protein
MSRRLQSLAKVEQAFRSLKTIGIHLRLTQPVSEADNGRCELKRQRVGEK